MIALFLALVETQEDKEKFMRLYSKYVKLVYWVAKKRVNNHHLAEECVQETFLYLAKNIHKVGDVESSSTKAYVATIADGIAIKVYNKEHRGVYVDADEETLENFAEPEIDSLFNNLDAMELSMVIDTALTDDEKTRLYLRYVYGYKIKEVSKLLNESYYITRKKLDSAIEKIKNYYNGEK